VTNGLEIYSWLSFLGCTLSLLICLHQWRTSSSWMTILILSISLCPPKLSRNFRNSITS
jgi:hypothetical protein